VLVDTDKAEIEVESFDAGWLDEVLVREGETVPVGTPIARIRGRARPPRSRRLQPFRHRRVSSRRGRRGSATASCRRAGSTHPRHAARAPPRAGARPRSREGPGSGADGAITREDVERAASAPAAPAPKVAVDKRAAMRSAIASAMERANREIPHYYLATRADLTHALARLAEKNAALPLPDRVLPAALFLRATARAAAEVPALNGFWRDGAFVPGEGVHVGVIVSLRSGGLLVPALRDAAAKSSVELMRELRGLVARARAGTLRSSEVSGATLSVTNLGEQGSRRCSASSCPRRSRWSASAACTRRRSRTTACSRRGPSSTSPCRPITAPATDTPAALPGRDPPPPGGARRAVTKSFSPAELRAVVSRCWAASPPKPTRPRSRATRRCATSSTWTRWIS